MELSKPNGFDQTRQPIKIKEQKKIPKIRLQGKSLNLPLK